MTLFASGGLAVGLTTDPGAGAISARSTSAAHVFDSTSGTEVIAISKANGSRAYLGTVSSSDSGLQVKDSGGALTLTVGSSGKTLTLQGGTVATGTGITFPATQSASTDANTLDDYEEGIFTPVLNRDSSSPTVTYVVQTGKYTKIGNMITVTIALQTSAVIAAGSGNTTITGLPFANGSTTYTGQGSIGYNSAAVNTLSGSWMSSTTVYFRSGTRSDGNDAGGWGAGFINMSITYLI
jgi:hypothetical protein